MYPQLLREWIDAGEPVWLPLTGDSMAPFLPSGSNVLVSQRAAGQIGFGDLLLYEAEGRIICHRLLRRRRQGSSYTFLTKGDGWRKSDPWISADQVIGKVVAIRRSGRLVSLDTRLRALQAVTIAALSLAVTGSLAVSRRVVELLRAHRGCGFLP